MHQTFVFCTIFQFWPRVPVCATLKMNDSLENAFAALGLSDSDSDDTITPMWEPSVKIGRSSRNHSYGRLSDGEDEHHDTPRPSGRAHMYTD